MNTVQTLATAEHPTEIFEQTAKAYADSLMDWETAQKLRNLNFRASSPLSLEDWVTAMSRATPGGYNEFNAVRVGRIFKQLGVNGNAVFTPAREGSVCVYVKAEKWFLEHLKENASALRADEAHIIEGELRLWWD